MESSLYFFELCKSNKNGTCFLWKIPKNKKKKIYN